MELPQNDDFSKEKTHAIDLIFTRNADKCATATYC